MLIGMTLYRLGVLRGELSKRVYVAMSVVGLAIGLALIAYGGHLNAANEWSIRTSMFLGALPNQLGSIFVSLGYIGIIMRLLQSPLRNLMQATLAPVGRMALTNYLGQSVICTTIFYGHGLGWFGSVDRVGQMQIVIAIWAFQIVASMLWMKRYRFGPVEYLWRTMTYGRSV